VIGVVVPYRAGDPVRDLALDYIRAWYREEHPEISQVTVGGDEWPDRPWSKGAALDHIVRNYSDADILIVADSDVLVRPEALRRSVAAVSQGAAWSMPHGTVYRLSRQATNAVYGGWIDGIRALQARSCHRPPHPGPPGGGIVVLTRDAYEASGGIDPRFTNWGGDDISWARALDTMVGPCVRFDAPMWHLWHPPMFRRPGNRASAENEVLAARYGDAAGKVSQMRALIGEHR
jgi:hypothetical protein